MIRNNQGAVMKHKGAGTSNHILKLRCVKLWPQGGSAGFPTGLNKPTVWTASSAGVCTSPTPVLSFSEQGT